MIRIATGAFGILLAAGTVSPAAAALLHHYGFDGSVTDSVGAIDGTLVGGATATGGELSLNGSSQYAQLNGYAIPYSNFSITFDATINAYAGGVMEMISQGYSTGPGFYIGLSGNVFRLGDSISNTGVATPSLGVSHSYELIAGSSSTQFFIDGAQVYSSSTQVTAPQSTTPTRIGAQFQNIGEYFDGTISNLSIYSGAPSVPEPATWTLLAAGLITLPILRGRRRMPRRNTR